MIHGEKNIPASNAGFGRKKRGWKAYFIRYLSKTAMCALNLPCTSYRVSKLNSFRLSLLD